MGVVWITRRSRDNHRITFAELKSLYSINSRSPVDAFLKLSLLCSVRRHDGDACAVGIIDRLQEGFDNRDSGDVGILAGCVVMNQHRHSVSGSIDCSAPAVDRMILSRVAV